MRLSKRFNKRFNKRFKKRFKKRFNKRFHNGFPRTSSPLCSPSWLSRLSWLTLSQQAPAVLNAPSIRCLKHLHLVGSCCILGDVVHMAAILWCGSQTSTRTPHPSASWPIVMPQCVCVCVRVCVCACVCVLCVCVYSTFDTNFTSNLYDSVGYLLTSAITASACVS